MVYPFRVGIRLQVRKGDTPMKNPLKQNIGLLDRVLRVFVGVALIALATLVANGIVQSILIILSLPLLFSGITGFCPTYTLFGISTARTRSHSIPHMLRACCSAGKGSHSCPPMVENAMDPPDGRKQ